MNKKGFIGVLFLFLFILGLTVSVVYGVAYSLTDGQEIITVKDKWVKYQGEDAKYLVSSEDGQVFQITDSIVKWRFDSSNLYANIDNGCTYKIDTQGWRFGFMSDYKNIISIELVE